ncbi:hypothetical protein G5B10_14905 [Fluviicola sp. SGL-29]|nr:hypothetical protein [Fluviicola sp. SGL-29]
MEFDQNKKKKWNGKRNVPSRSSQRIFTKSYSDEAVDRLKRLLENQKQRGEERFYGIKVDGEFCVYKTTNLRMFDDYKEFVDSSTEAIEVILYFGTSNNCNRHIFYLKDKPLSGINAPVDVDKKIEEALAKKDQEYLIKSLKEKVAEQEELIEQLEDELEELKGKTDLRGLLKDGIALMGAFKGQVPDSTLSGTENPPDQPTVEVEVNEEGNEEEDLSEQEKVFNDIYQSYGSDGVKQVVNLMLAIAKSETIRNGVNKLIEEENKKRGAPKSS